MKNSNRSASLDLIRCLAMLLVVLFHSYLYNGYYFRPQNSFAIWLANGFRWFSVGCIGLFLMLTGYLQSPKTDLRSCYRNLIPVLICYLMASAISIPLRHFVFHDIHTPKQWLSMLIQFGATSYGWYVVMYLCLSLLAPFINVMLKHLSNKALLLFAAVLLVITALPGATPLPIAPNYWRNLYPLSYYVLGALVRRLQPIIPSWIGILCALGMAFLMGTVTLLSTNQDLSQAINWEFQDLWVVFIVVCLFISLYKLTIPACFHKILAFGANGCLGACMLSHLLDGWCYKIFPLWRTPSRYILLFLCISIPIYVVSLVAGNLLQKCANIPAKYISKVLNILPGESLDSGEVSVK